MRIKVYVIIVMLYSENEVEGSNNSVAV